MEKICKNCKYFPCLKPQCQIEKNGCNDYISTVTDMLNKLEEDRKKKNEW